ncbi:hypothetical protein [Sphingobium lignivorans]|uniref:Uncharacterized protein n=1 Tax=Sphingobium lignivorans TaxID=2735886 RepID=A0ABR6NK39_9SPHN|nr:hypothetical protein [Sphingobium lignivorans]MBB5987644.1 hypothetical protein [Sphingobium lignivorans]
MKTPYLGVHQTGSRPVDTSLDNYMVPPPLTPEEEELADLPVRFDASTAGFEKLRSMLNARKARARRFKHLCNIETRNYDGCPSDLGNKVGGFYSEVLNSVEAYVADLPVDYRGLMALNATSYGFGDWLRFSREEGNRLVNLVEAAREIVSNRRAQIEPILRPQIVADMASGTKSGLFFDLFGIDKGLEVQYREWVAIAKMTKSVPSVATNEGKILRAAIKALASAPTFALSRGIGTLQELPSSVRIGMTGARYDYLVEVRNATCRPLKTANSCTYEARLGYEYVLAGMALPKIQSEWFKRTDTFLSKDGSFYSADLNSAMAKFAEPSVRASSQSGDPNKHLNDHWNSVQLMQNIQDVRDGLYRH